MLSNQILVKLGNISAFSFLIHYPIILWTDALLKLIGVNTQGILKMGIIVAEFGLTIAFTKLYVWMNTRMKNVKAI